MENTDNPSSQSQDSEQVQLQEPRTPKRVRILLVLGLTAFMQTHFLIFANSQILVMAVTFEIIYFLTIFISKDFSLNSVSSELKTSSGILKFQERLRLSSLHWPS